MLSYLPSIVKKILKILCGTKYTGIYNAYLIRACGISLDSEARVYKAMNYGKFFRLVSKLTQDL